MYVGAKRLMEEEEAQTILAGGPGFQGYPRLLVPGWPGLHEIPTQKTDKTPTKNLIMLATVQ